jgi:hypothetical protein
MTAALAERIGMNLLFCGEIASARNRWTGFHFRCATEKSCLNSMKRFGQTMAGLLAIGVRRCYTL